MTQNNTASSDGNNNDDHDHSKDDRRPLTSREKAKCIVFIFGYPLGLCFLMLPGAWFTTFPSFPPPLWYGFWVTVTAIPLVTLICMIPMFHYPALIRARMNKITAGKTESPAEQRFHKVTSWMFFVGTAGLSFDACSHHDQYPWYWNWMGVLLWIVGMAGVLWVFRTNPFAARVVHVQPGQKLITHGPYAIVRHPMYAAICPMFWGFSLCIGSFWGLLPMTLILIMTAFRTYDEENFLVGTFGQDYENYRRQVPYRMLPYVF